MKTYLQRIVHDSLRAMPADDRASEIFSIEAAPTPEYSSASQRAPMLSNNPVMDNQSARTESVAAPTPRHEFSRAVKAVQENSTTSIDRKNITSAIAPQAGTAALPNSLTDNGFSAPNKSAVEAGSATEVLPKPVASAAPEQIENSVRATPAMRPSKQHSPLQEREMVEPRRREEQSPEHEERSRKHEEQLRQREEQLMAANAAGVDKKNTEIASAQVVTTRAIAQTPQKSMTHTTAPRREPPAPQLHIGEVRITVQDEPRKNAKPKRKRNAESESRLLIRSL